MNQLDNDNLLQRTLILAPQEQAPSEGQIGEALHMITIPHAPPLMLQEPSEEQYNSPEIPNGNKSKSVKYMTQQTVINCGRLLFA